LIILTELHDITGDPRYRPSVWLRRRALLGVPLTTPEG
jgi:3-hydroxybutyryl-CoA dehydrogenase